VTKIDVVTAK